ncbi:MAG: transporter substrate-binding domain-containing protein [Alphaproteobacteria bacterium]
MSSRARGRRRRFNMRPLTWLVVVLAAVVTGYAGARLAAPQAVEGMNSPPAAAVQAAVRETAYDRVMRTNTLRCGYILYEPFVRKDPNSGKFSGIAVDLAEEIGRVADLKIEWTDEVGWGTTVEGLKTGRYDALCVGFWRLPTEGKHVFYTLPFSYSMVDVLTRADDTRFDADLALINQPDIRIISADGREDSIIARRDFPKAKLTELSNLAGDSDLMESVASGKADISFQEAATFERYLAANPDKLKKLPLPAPLRVYQNTFALPQDEKLKSMLDTAINVIVENGGMDIMLDKYDPGRKLLLRIKRPGAN